MSSIVVNCVEDLYFQCKNHRISVYGAKTVAQRTCCYLESRGLVVESFLVSGKFENPYELQGKPVQRIEEESREFDCLVLAVNPGIVWDVEEELSDYPVRKMVIVSPLMVDKFPAGRILSGQSFVSEKAFLSDEVQIVSDDTSTITIGDCVLIQEGAKILATGNSRISIKNGVCIGEKALIRADGGSEISIMPRVEIGENTTVRAINNSNLYMGQTTSIGDGSSLVCRDDSKLILEGSNRLARFGVVLSSRHGSVRLGTGTTVNGFLYMDCADSIVDIGEDNMFSHYVKLSTGSHSVIDQRDGKDITNRKAIRTGKHVWVGMGTALLPGCDIGDGSIVGASAVVNKGIPAYSTCAGNPARVLRSGVSWDRRSAM